MSVQTYAELNILPAPVTTGGLQTFIDLYGEVWVANPGAQGGNWAKARDALHANVFYNAAGLAPPTVNTIFPHDTVQRDVYGLWTGSPSYQYTIPISGWYRFYFHWVASGAVSTNYVGVSFVVNGSQLTAENMIVCVNGNITPRGQVMSTFFTGDLVQSQYMSSVTGLTVLTGAFSNGFSMAYMGAWG